VNHFGFLRTDYATLLSTSGHRSQGAVCAFALRTYGHPIAHCEVFHKRRLSKLFLVTGNEGPGQELSLFIDGQFFLLKCVRLSKVGTAEVPRTNAIRFCCQRRGERVPLTWTAFSKITSLKDRNYTRGVLRENATLFVAAWGCRSLFQSRALASHLN
jgi:hypothetical protein